MTFDYGNGLSHSNGGVIHFEKSHGDGVDIGEDCGGGVAAAVTIPGGAGGVILGWRWI
jgi:hypothetical protein